MSFTRQVVYWRIKGRIAATRLDKCSRTVEGVALPGARIRLFCRMVAPSSGYVRAGAATLWLRQASQPPPTSPRHAQRSSPTRGKAKQKGPSSLPCCVITSPNGQGALHCLCTCTAAQWDGPAARSNAHTQQPPDRHRGNHCRTYLTMFLLHFRDDVALHATCNVPSPFLFFYL